jgi:hypothetical protein
LKFYLALRKFEFTSDIIEKDRTLFMAPILKNMMIDRELSQSIHKNRPSKRTKKNCNINWPFCLREYDDEDRKITSVLVFKTSNVPNLIENHFHFLDEKNRRMCNIMNESISI